MYPWNIINIWFYQRLVSLHLVVKFSCFLHSLFPFLFNVSSSVQKRIIITVIIIIILPVLFLSLPTFCSEKFMEFFKWHWWCKMAWTCTVYIYLHTCIELPIHLYFLHSHFIKWPTNSYPCELLDIAVYFFNDYISVVRHDISTVQDWRLVPLLYHS